MLDPEAQADRFRQRLADRLAELGYRPPCPGTCPAADVSRETSAGVVEHQGHDFAATRAQANLVRWALETARRDELVRAAIAAGVSKCRYTG